MKSLKLYFIISIVIVASLQAYSIYVTNREKHEVISRLKEEFEVNDLDEAIKLFQLVDKELQYQKRSYVTNKIVNSVSAFISIIIALLGTGVAFNKLIIERQKIKEEKLSLIFNELWSGITSDNSNVRAGGVTGLQQFIKPALSSFHDRVAIGLSIAGKRSDNNLLLKRTITSVFEVAVRDIPNSMTSVNWQGMHLHRPNFSNLDLSNFDFRDTEIYKGDFRNSILRDTRFNAAKLIGNNFDSAIVKNTNFDYADLTDSSFCNVVLDEAILYNAKIKNINLFNSDLRKANYSRYSLNWKLVKNWRTAVFNEEDKEYLASNFYPDVSGSKILILMWEFPPKVEGGTWSALHNLIEELRNKGKDITVIIPWSVDAYDFFVFGNEVKIIPVGNSDKSKSDLSDEVYTPYSSYVSPYTSSPHLQHLYSKGNIELFDRINKFRNDTIGAIQELKIEFDIIYSHDWITFETGFLLKDEFNKPLICHFHSTEYDRQEKSSKRIKLIENKALKKADKVIVPSEITMKKIQSNYNISDCPIKNLPNLLGLKKLTFEELGNFSSNKVSFIGRLSWQKGPDLFIDTAIEASKRNIDFEFHINGKGEQLDELRSKADKKAYDPNYDWMDYRRKSYVKFQEFTEWSKREQLFNNVFCIIVPSRHDPFNMVILEAMQARVPVIYTEECGIGEYIDAGIKIDEYKIDTILNSLAELKNNKELWSSTVRKQEVELVKFKEREYVSDYINEIEDTVD
ncbi:glycosyltransferase [Sunxiuqinia sp. A32]